MRGLSPQSHCSVMTGSPSEFLPVRGSHAGAAARRAAVVGLAHAVAQRQLRPVVRVQRLLDVVVGAEAVDTVRIRWIHSMWSTAPGLFQVRVARLLEQADRVLAQPAPVERALQLHDLHVRSGRSAPRRSCTALLIVGSAVALAQSASLFQKPQPPVALARVAGLASSGSRAPLGIGDG